MDLRSVPGIVVYDDGTMVTPTVRLTGTYDGQRLTLTEPAVPVPTPVHPEVAGELPATACADPGDGQSTHEQRETAIAYAQAQPDLGALWFSDATRVLNVSFTGNVDRHRQALRAVFPGPLCVVQAQVAKAELDAVARQLHADRDFQRNHRIEVLSSSQTSERLHVLVAAAMPSQIRLLENRYGPITKVTSWLQPAQPDNTRTSTATSP